MKFNSQICTTKEQSKRLLALGLKKETADMHYHWLVCNEWPKLFLYFNPPQLDDIPAWSLHRLIEMMPKWIDTIEDSLMLTIEQGRLVCYQGIIDDGQGFVIGHTSLYDSIICVIEKLIEEGYFNKEYLEE